jgi:predicted transcriptional regulator
MMKLNEIRDILLADVIVGSDKLNIPLRAGAGSDLMSDILTGPTHDVLFLTGLNNIQVIRTSLIAGVSAVVLVRGKKPSPEMIAQAEEHGLPVLSTPFTMFTSCGRLFRAGLRGVEIKAPISPSDQ